MALAEVMMAAAIMCIVALGAASFQASQVKENRAMTEKVATIDVSRFVTGMLASNANCSLLVAPANMVIPSQATFNATSVSSTTPHKIVLKSIPTTSIALGATASVVAPTLLVLPAAPSPGIELRVTSATSADLVIRFDGSKLVRTLHDLVFPNIQLTTIGPAAATTITGCGSGDLIATCLGNCGGAFPKKIGAIAMYNWANRDGTVYYTRGPACGSAPYWSGWAPGGAPSNGRGPVNAGAMYICGR